MTIKTGTYVGVGSEVFKSCVDFLYRTNSYVWVTFEPAQKGGVVIHTFSQDSTRRQDPPRHAETAPRPSRMHRGK